MNSPSVNKSINTRNKTVKKKWNGQTSVGAVRPPITNWPWERPKSTWSGSLSNLPSDVHLWHTKWTSIGFRKLFHLISFYQYNTSNILRNKRRWWPPSTPDFSFLCIGPNCRGTIHKKMVSFSELLFPILNTCTGRKAPNIHIVGSEKNEEEITTTEWMWVPNEYSLKVKVQWQRQFPTEFISISYSYQIFINPQTPTRLGHRKYPNRKGDWWIICPRGNF